MKHPRKLYGFQLPDPPNRLEYATDSDQSAYSVLHGTKSTPASRLCARNWYSTIRSWRVIYVFLLHRIMEDQRPDPRRNVSRRNRIGRTSRDSLFSLDMA